MNAHHHDFSAVLATHASALSASDCASGRKMEQALAKLGEAEQRLIQTPARRPIEIAYKLVASFAGMTPDHPHLSISTAEEIINSPHASGTERLIASAFLDLYELDTEERQQPKPEGGSDAALLVGGQLDQAWQAARSAFYALKDKDEAGLLADDDGSVFQALERWESLPPPDVAGMAEVMREAMAFIGLDLAWQDMNDPRTMRDYLDGGDQHEIFAIRYYQHTLRLAGIQGGPLSTPSIAGLFPSFSMDDHIGEEPHAMQEAWARHHADTKLHPQRRAELVEWWRAILSDPATCGAQSVIGSENCSAAWDASSSLNARANAA